MRRTGDHLLECHARGSRGGLENFIPHADPAYHVELSREPRRDSGIIRTPPAHAFTAQEAKTARPVLKGY
jgi:hypothetical protein